jgi:hypothetical protein
LPDGGKIFLKDLFERAFWKCFFESAFCKSFLKRRRRLIVGSYKKARSRFPGAG